MNSFKKTLSITLLSTLFITLYSNADSGHRHKKGNGGEWCPEANLSDAQRESIRSMRAGFREQTKDLSKEERKEARKAFWQDVANNVLENDEQRAAFSTCRENRKKERRNRCPEANLSDAQRESIRSMRAEFKEQTKDLSKEERKEARKAFWQDVANNVLESDEQRAAFSECRENRKKRRRDRQQRQANEN